MKTLLNTITTYIAGNSDLSDDMMSILLEAEGQDLCTPTDREQLAQHALECVPLDNLRGPEFDRASLVVEALTRG